ncbi:hypothetical protein [Ornithinicoccus hortensis]|uniref:hypothetical protein n=1 Tax=Ornithinicoccus hortensis TaxID=82346 RepID=UPI00114FD87B|nr:hypothetical protein [Ornithinicoccus hortensis]
MYPEENPGPNPELWYEYAAVVSCVGNTPENPELVRCVSAEQYCRDVQPQSEGPLSLLYRREADDGGPLTPWQHFSHTCYTSHVPPRSGAEVELTEAMIIEQFHRTAFALPTASLQPEDNRALVNLPVYFALEWPEEGFEPGEVDTTTIVGHEVRIRPVFQDATYSFGDGTSEGPTASMGGTYPDGDITHEYASSGEVGPSITVTYGGEVSVDGGGWSTIPATIEISGPAQPLEVLTSRNRLRGD